MLFGKPGSVYIDQSSLLVQASAANSFLAAQAAALAAANTVGSGEAGSGYTSGSDSGSSSTTTVTGVSGIASAGTVTAIGATQMKRFHGSVALDPISMGLDAAKIAEEIVQHFTSNVGTAVSITLEIEAHAPSGINDSTRRAVQENARTLRFISAEFEEE